MPAKAPRPVLKFKKSPIGTKQAVNRISKKPLIGERYYLEINSRTPKAGEWSATQKAKLKKLAQENARVIKGQKYALEDYKLEVREQRRRGVPGYDIRANRPQGLFVNVPLAEIKIDPKLGQMVFTRDYIGKPRQFRITRADLLERDYYKEIGLFNNLLESRKLVSGETNASVKKWRAVKKQKVIAMVDFLKLSNLKGAGINLNIAKQHFTLPEILRHGGYKTPELLEHFSREQIQKAEIFNVKRKF